MNLTVLQSLGRGAATLGQEMRAAYRRLNRQPWFAIGAIASLAVGMSLTVAVLGVVKSIILRPLPYREPSRIGFVYQALPAGRTWGATMLSAEMTSALRNEATAFEHLAVTSWTHSVELTVEGKRGGFLGAARVTPNWFSVLGVRPLLGRVFDGTDRASDRGIVISHAAWTAWFGGDEGIIGREVPIVSWDWESGQRIQRHRVIGIMPPGVEFPDRTSVWFVLTESDITGATAGRYSSFSLMGRLRDGASFLEANTQASALFARIHRGDLLRTGRSARVIPLREQITASMRDPLRLWTAAALVVALLCAVNFASMSLARGMRRRGEIAVRAALGADRGDVVRGLVAEAVIVATFAGAIATMLASWYLMYSGRLLAGRVLPVAPTIDWITMSCGVGLTILIGSLFALAPALELAKVDLRTLLQGEAIASTARRKELFGHRALVALQLCLALTAVATVTALIQADRRVRSLNTWFDYDQIVFADFFQADEFDHGVATALLDHASRADGVVAAAMRWREQGALVWNDGGRVSGARVLPATPNLLNTLGLTLAAGRLPTDAERRSGGFLVASTDMAIRLAGSARAAVGEQITIRRQGRTPEVATIIGVAPRIGGLGNWGTAADLFDFQDWPRSRAGSYVGLYIRVDGPSANREQPLRTSLASLHRRGVIVRTATDLMDEALGRTRGRNQFLWSVAMLALLLAAVGAFGMTTYVTELRLRELGIRIALGADALRVAHAMFADLWWMAPAGVGIGTVAAGLVTSYLDALYSNTATSNRLIELSTGPTAAAMLALLVIAAAGTAMPLRRVLRLDVMRTVQGGT